MDDFHFKFCTDNVSNATIKRMSRTLLKCVLGTVIEIKVKTKPGNQYSEVETIQSLEYKLVDSIKNSPLDLDKDMPKDAEVCKILDRCELLQQKYADFLESVKIKIDFLRILYNKNEYDLYVTKIVPRIDELDESSEDEPFVYFNPDLTPEDQEDDDSEENHLYPEVTIKEDVDEYPQATSEGLLTIGPNGTKIQQKDYDALRPRGANGATRLLCDIIFGDETLATHSLTGTPSPAFKGRERPPKKKLDPLKTDDITNLITSMFNVSQQMVRSIISIKCSDAVKKLRRRSTRSHSL